MEKDTTFVSTFPPYVHAKTPNYVRQKNDSREIFVPVLEQSQILKINSQDAVVF